MAFAKETSVSIEQTERDIRSTLRRYGATSFGSFESSTAAMIAFEMHGRRVVFKLPLPDRNSPEFTATPSGKWARSQKQAEAAWDQACRSRWRALLLCIKAKLESVEAKIETFDDAFLAHIQLPGGAMVGEEVREAIAKSYASGKMTPLLPGPRP